MYIILNVRNAAPVMNPVTQGVRIFDSNREAELYITDNDMPRESVIIFELTERPAVS